MTPPGALAITALIALFASLVVAFVADESSSRYRRPQLSRLGWALFASAMVMFAGSAWWAVLS
jgi:hypothetical protein